MPYVLGIDIGETHVSAAVSRAMVSNWATPEVVWLDAQSWAIPTVVQVNGGGIIARGFVTRVGDDVPMVVGGEAYQAQSLVAVLAMWIVERVVAREGEDPEHIVLTHPATWGSYRAEVLHEALWDIGLGDLTLLPQPVAVAEIHTSRNFSGHTLGVFDLGRNDFTTSVVRHSRESGGFEMLGCQQSIDPIGTEDFDEALAGHVRLHLSRELGARYVDRLALSGLRAECGNAIEKLASSAETEVLIDLPEEFFPVPVERLDFEELIRPAVQVAVETMVQTVNAAGLAAEQLDGLLLVGQASRIPLLALLLAAEFPAITVDDHAQAAAGAALIACRLVAPPAAQEVELYTGGYETELSFESPPRPPVRITRLSHRGGARRRGSRSLAA